MADHFRRTGQIIIICHQTHACILRCVAAGDQPPESRNLRLQALTMLQVIDGMSLCTTSVPTCYQGGCHHVVKLGGPVA